MLRFSLRRLRSARRNFSQSPELRLRNGTSLDHQKSPSTSSRPLHDGPPAAEIRPERSPFLGPSMSRFHQKPLSSGRNDMRNVCRRWFSSINERDEISIEEDVERKMGWLLKLIFVGTASAVAYQFFPYMGDTLLQQSISLLQVKDPLFKRMGASRLSRFAIDDERRMKVVEMGGALELLNMLEAAKDDKTRKEALKTLFALSHSDEAAEVLHQAGATRIVRSTPDSDEHAEVGTYKSSLLKRFQELEPGITSLDAELI